MTLQDAIRKIKKHHDILNKEASFAVHTLEALNMAVDALDKQIPKKTLWGGDNRTSWRSCPMCHSRMHNTCKFCSQCGQALDWRKGND